MSKIILSLIVVLLSGCLNESEICMGNSCLINNPVTELDWLRTEIEDIQNMDSTISKFLFISMASLNKTTVFFANNCCPFCSTIPPILKNCNGEPIGYISEVAGNLEYMGFTIKNINPNQIKEIQIVWKPENFACQIN